MQKVPMGVITYILYVLCPIIFSFSISTYREIFRIVIYHNTSNSRHEEPKGTRCQMSFLHESIRDPSLFINIDKISPKITNYTFRLVKISCQAQVTYLRMLVHRII